MPTGYTCDVQNGKIVEFKTFAMECARAFGALITMRDDPTGVPIPEELKVEHHYYEYLQDNLKRRSDFFKLNMDELYQEWREEQIALEREKVKQQKEADLYRQRYETMLAKVLEWEPPSPDHLQLKNFMIDQLQQSINLDCKVYNTNLLDIGFEDWVKRRGESLNRSVEYAQRSLADAEERIAGRNKWLKELRESLK